MTDPEFLPWNPSSIVTKIKYKSRRRKPFEDDHLIRDAGAFRLARKNRKTRFSSLSNRQSKIRFSKRATGELERRGKVEHVTGEWSRTSV